MSSDLQPAAYHDYIRRGADEILSAIRRGPLDATVPDCPGWTLLELVDHLGGVHQWATSVIETGSPERDTTGIGAGDDPARWYENQVGRLLDVLTATDPKQPTWTMLPDYRFVDFWSRRQAHEVAMHAIDAARAIGLSAGYDAELAADGIEEVLGVMAPRMARRYEQVPDLRGPLLLDCTDVPPRWLLRPTATPPTDWQLDWQALDADDPLPDAAATRSDTAENLLLGLWKRRTDGVSRVSGDRAVVDAFFASRLTP